MNRLFPSLLLTAPALALLAATTPAAAQLEPLPNVLLLVDTSGSMEYRTGFNTGGQEVAPYCNPVLQSVPDTPQGPRPCGPDEDIAGQTCAQFEKSRWVDLVEVLTGEIKDYRCETLDRANATSGDKFSTLYRIDGDPPRDTKYSNAYHRPLLRLSDTAGVTTTGICGPAPRVPNPSGDPQVLAAGMPVDQIAWRDWNYDGTNADDPDCQQLDTDIRQESPSVDRYFGGGLLDTYADQIRFGLMTFDTVAGFDVSNDSQRLAGTGQWSFLDGMAQTWNFISYHNGIYDYAHLGHPIDCSQPTPMEVGARSQWAPAWEGRLIGFGDPDDAVPNRRRNQSIQRELLSVRPYGATPVAGMLHDAYEFLFDDEQVDPMGTGYPLGPHLAAPDADAFADCRQHAIILLTDGEPNLELRPSCEPDAVPVVGESDPSYAPPGAACPFHTPQWLARELSGKGLGMTTRAKVPVFVIGFSLNEVEIGGVTKTCSQLNLAGGDCSEATIEAQPTASQRALRTCCLLNEIAFWGDTGVAYFASDRDQLQHQIDEVLSQVSARRTARTRPVFAGAADFSTGNTSYRFFTGFESRGAELRRGVIERKRVTCENPADDDPNPVPTEQEVNPAEGDDFVANVNEARGAGRNFFTYEGGPLANTFASGSTLRPYVVGSDGLGGASVGTTVEGTMSAVGNFITNLSPAALGLGTAGSCPARIEDALDTDVSPLPTTKCRDIALNWLFGVPQSGYRSRCDANECDLIADVFRATPTLVGRPNALIPDETYRRFAADAESYNETATGPNDHRPLVLYTSTNDGMLHAFRVDSSTADQSGTTTPEMNELWAFLPPAVLPQLPGLYPGRKLLLLDGEPVARDVVATPSTRFPGYPWTLERSSILTRVGQGTTDPAQWRTILVQSFGGHSVAGSGFYAVDVTSPEVDATGGKGGPKFLWQLTVDSANNPLFGNTVAAPLITTVFAKTSTGGDPHEVAVAVLPGGAAYDDGGPGVTGTGCALPTAGITAATGYGGYSRRTNVRCYPVGPNAGQPSRSVTIVRLDSGEILRTFRNQVADVDPISPSATPRLTVSATKITDAELTSPITGRPAAFPSGTGAIADRIYVGDADGVLWRIDLSQPDPAHWTMVPFFDAYNAKVAPPTDGTGANITPPGAADIGQPITLAPVISTDTSGAVIVNFSTGSQEFLDAPYFQATLLPYSTAGVTPPVMNMVWSIREVEDIGAGTLSVKPEWYLRLIGGERVTGPLQLFNGQLFFTSLWPVEGAGLCTQPELKVWGVDYVTAVPPATPPTDPTTADLSVGGQARFPYNSGYVQCLSSVPRTSDPNGATYNCVESALDSGAASFGITIAQVQTCSEGDGSTTDPFMGGTSHTSVAHMTPGRFEAVIQTGNAGTAVAGGSSRVAKFELETPATVPIIESWAAIVE
jgi:type IV pilus assembly protein PilY1